MKTIYKFKLKVITSQMIKLPTGFEILRVGIQDDEPVVWIMVNTDNSPTRISIKIYGTGEVIPERFNLTYIDTFQYQTQYWFHVFTEGELDAVL
ncbi:MAG: hypothetical protein KUG67_02850 [Proteobacteria bacterium]|nr:hypothetical protein [Pseudomonadota bacterium]